MNRVNLEVRDKDGKIVKCYIDLDAAKRDEEFYKELDGKTKVIRGRYKYSNTSDSK